MVCFSALVETLELGIFEIEYANDAIHTCDITYITYIYIYMKTKVDCTVPVLAAQVNGSWFGFGLSNFGGWITVANEVSRLASCPFHCSPSILPWLLLGFVIGFLSAIFLTLCVILAWTFRGDLLRFCHPAPSFPARRTRLSGYLE